MRVNGRQRPGLVRLGPDGSVDLTFEAELAPQVSRMNLQMTPIAFDNDGRIIIAGPFVGDGMGIASPAVVRLQPDGKLDRSFKLEGSWMSGAINDTFAAVEVDRGNSIWVGGDFSCTVPDGTGGGGTREYRGAIQLGFDGRVDQRFQPNLWGTVHDLKLLPNGQVLLAGSFRLGDDLDASLIARVGPTGLRDPSFSVPSLAQADTTASAIRRIAIEGDGRLVLGGLVRYPPGGNSKVSVRHLLRLLPKGELDPEFDPGHPMQRIDSMGSVTDEFLTERPVNGAWIPPGEELVVAGDFDLVDGWERDSLARISLGGATPDRPDLVETPAAVFRLDFSRIRSTAHAYGYPRPRHEWLVDGQPGIAREQPIFQTDVPLIDSPRLTFRATNPSGSVEWGTIEWLTGPLMNPRIRFVDGQVRIFAGDGNLTRRYWLEYTESLTTGPWIELRGGDVVRDPIAYAGIREPGALLVDLPPADVDRFYRVRSE